MTVVRVRRVDLVQKLRAGYGDFVLFGLTPPKADSHPDKLRQLAATTMERLRTADPDGLVLYDIADEQDRNPDRPFPFRATIDPADYLADHLSEWRGPAIVYRAVGKYSEDTLRSWMQAQPTDRRATVLVGAASRTSHIRTSLRRAHDVRTENCPDLVTGGVIIPERQTARGDEHRRMLDKQTRGCTFFVSQVLYDVTAAKNLVSAYRDECDLRGAAPRPLVFTLSVCGSTKTLDLLTWLGVQVPAWAQRDLTRAQDPLGTSVDHARAVAAEMVSYCRRLEIPVGLNVESVSGRRAEVEAAVALATELRTRMRDRDDG